MRDLPRDDDAAHRAVRGALYEQDNAKRNFLKYKNANAPCSKKPTLPVNATLCNRCAVARSLMCDFVCFTVVG